MNPQHGPLINVDASAGGSCLIRHHQSAIYADILRRYGKSSWGNVPLISLKLMGLQIITFGQVGVHV